LYFVLFSGTIDKIYVIGLKQIQRHSMNTSIIIHLKPNIGVIKDTCLSYIPKLKARVQNVYVY